MARACRSRPPLRCAFDILCLLLIGCSAVGCAPAKWVGMRLIFDTTATEESRIQRDVVYVAEDPHTAKHRLDFFMPEGKDWPTLIFVHGGSWVEGDKNLTAGGIEIYGNIGAYYSSQGIAVAVINYRLQPEFTWRQQVLDVARAVEQTRRLAERQGGDPNGIFLSGHSAGAQLAALAAVADWPRDEVGSETSLCGVVAVSGAGYDLADATTYELGADPEYYRARFPTSGDDSGDWPQDASVVHQLDPTDPPFLVYYAGDEYPSLQHQAKLLHDRLSDAGVDSELAVVPNQGHRRIVLTFSQAEHDMTSRVQTFINNRHRECRGAPEAS